MNSTDSLLLKIEIIIYWRNWTWNTEVHSVRSVLFMKKSAVYQLTRKMEDDPDILWYLPRIYLGCSYWQTRHDQCEALSTMIVITSETFVSSSSVHTPLVRILSSSSPAPALAVHKCPGLRGINGCWPWICLLLGPSINNSIMKIPPQLLCTLPPLPA